MKILSLFDGISCGRVALERAGIPVSRYVAFEIDKYAIQVSRNNYPDIVQAGSVIKADYSEYKGFDLVMGGFPCTDLSINKRDRQGLKGERSSLFWELVRAIHEVKPRYFFVENNASMPKADRAIITKTLGVEPVQVNSAIVSGQQRKRLYWTNIPYTAPTSISEILVKDILTEPGFPLCVKDGKSQTIKAQYGKNAPSNAFRKGGYGATMVAAPVRIGQLGKGSQGDRVYSVFGKSVSLNANGGGAGANTGLYRIDLPDGDYIIRKLYPVECERLQGLPDGYTEGISNTQRYKSIGNGWNVDTILLFFQNLQSNKITNKLSENMKAYISGRITGLPYNEVEQTFSKAATTLEGLGFEVLNPLNNGLDSSASWSEHMVADIAMLMQANCVFMLPGWQESKGARIEHYIAGQMEKSIHYGNLL